MSKQRSARAFALLLSASVFWQGTAYGARDLYLEVFIDGQPTQLIAAFHEDDAGAFYAPGSELLEVGLAVPSGAASSQRVALADLSGVTFEYSEADQTIAFSTRSAEARVARVVMAEQAAAADIDDGDFAAVESGDDATDEGLFDDADFAPDIGGYDEAVDAVPRAAGQFAVVLNYSLGVAGSIKHGSVSGFDLLTGQVDGRISTRFGSFSSGALVGLPIGTDAYAARENKRLLTRLDTSWNYADTSRALAYTLGDTITGGLSWTRPVRIGGGRISRDLGLRPDLVTVPLPDVESSAAVPSSVEVLVNGGSAYSGSVPAGPFRIKDVSAPVGRSTAKVVITAPNGERREETLTLSVPPGLLAPGAFSFSLEGGFPRRGYGIASFDYADAPMAFATARVGVTDWLTLEAHAEGGRSVQNGGLGAAFALGKSGSASVAAAASRSDAGTGYLLAASAQVTAGPVTIHGSTRRTFGEYEDVASATAVCSTNGATCGRPARSIDRLGVSLNRALLGFQTGLGYSAVVDPGGKTGRVLDLTLSRSFNERASFYARGGWDFEVGGPTFYAGLTAPLGNWGHASASAIRHAYEHGLPDGQISLSRTTPEEGGLGGRIYLDRRGDRLLAAAEASYTGQKVRAHAGVGATRVDGEIDLAVNAGVEGAVVLMNGIHFARRIGDAFAVIETGMAGVTVTRENRVVGQTGRGGRLLVPDLRGNEENLLGVLIEGLPAGASIGVTEQRIVPLRNGGLSVPFAVSDGSLAAIVVVVDEAGEPLPVGTAGAMDGVGGDIVVGYDGEAWIDGLGDVNEVTFLLAGGGTCTARFAFDVVEDEVQPRIGPVPCLPSGARSTVASSTPPALPSEGDSAS